MNEEQVVEAISYLNDSKPRKHEVIMQYNQNVRNAADAIHKDAYSIAALKNSTNEMRENIDRDRVTFSPDTLNNQFEEIDTHFGNEGEFRGGMNQ
jgi:hypothetical protein